MGDLNSPEVYRKLDPSNMIRRIGELPNQCRQAWQSVTGMPLPPDYETVNKVIILGMGGSAIGGDMVARIAQVEGKVGVQVHRDYDLPPWVDEHTLVIASSYSGNTEETISAFTKAIETPAKKLAITTGGRLQQLASENSVPLFMFNYKAEPRAAFGYSFFSLLAFLNNLGIIPTESLDVDETIELLEKQARDWDKSVPLESNEAKHLASELSGHLIAIYGAGILTKVADRWKAQFNECSKTWAFAEAFPELNHNAVVGYQFPSLLVEDIFVVILRTTTVDSRIKMRCDVTCELLDNAGVSHALVESEGKSHLSQLMSTVLFGDFVSYYLAILNDVDPSPVEAIDFLKAKLASNPD